MCIHIIDIFCVMNIHCHVKYTYILIITFLFLQKKDAHTTVTNLKMVIRGNLTDFETLALNVNAQTASLPVIH